MLLAAAAQVLLAPAVLGAVGVVGRGQAQEAALQVPDHPLGTVRRRGPLPLQSAPPAEEQTVIHLTESLQDLGNLSDSKSNRWMGGVPIGVPGPGRPGPGLGLGIPLVRLLVRGGVAVAGLVGRDA